MSHSRRKPETLDKYKKAVDALCDALRTVNSLESKNTELCSVIENVRNHANSVETLRLPVKEPLFDALKQELPKVRDLGSQLEAPLIQFGEKLQDLGHFATANLSGDTIPPEHVKKFCDELFKAYDTAKNSSDVLNRFFGELSDSQLLAEKLAAKWTKDLKQMSAEKYEAASSSRNLGIAKAGGLAALGAGLLALGFFTGGATWITAGAIACGVGATALAVKTAVDVRQMRGLAEDIRANTNKLNNIAKELAICVDRAICLDEETAATLEKVITFINKDLEKDFIIEQQRKEIAQLKEQVKQQGKN